MRVAASYADRLSNPVPRGSGAHSWLMSTANLAALTGQDAQEAFVSIRGAADSKVSDREIAEAIQKAFREHTGGTWTPAPRPKPVVSDGKAALHKIIEKSRFSTEAELIASSPIPIPDDPKTQQRLFLQTVFQWGDFVFSGDRAEPGTVKTIHPRCEWIEGGAPGPFTIINPLTAFPCKKADGGFSYRADGCVKIFRHCLVEFDNIEIEDQIRFWSALPLPIKAIIHTGNKSLHAWIDVPALGHEITSLETWQKYVKNDLYDAILRGLGVDATCSNPARLARIPGVFRTEKNQWQRLLWLSPEGRAI